MSRISSPCVKVCVMDAARDVCVGCGRTLEEIGAWLRLTEAERARIMRELPARLAVLSDLNPEEARPRSAPK